MNFVIANGVVAVPVYGTGTEVAAIEALQTVFPDRDVIGVPSIGLLGSGDAGGGSFHCITPARTGLMTKNTLTVATIRNLLWAGHGGQYREDRGLHPQVRGLRGASHSAFGAVSGHLFLHAAGPQDGLKRPIPPPEHPCVLALAKLAKELRIVIPVSFFEKDGPHYFNSVAVADADGEILGIYRKSHIPDGPGYQEKYYFRPGNTGFKVWKTKHRRVSA